jgi:hypothetical protein
MSDVGDVAKALAPLIDNFAKMTGPMSEELGMYFGTKVREFRQKNITKILDGSYRLLEDAGKPINPVPPRLLIPILEAASVEDNPTLQDMWSGLLASASDQADNMSPSYAETLKALTPTDARSIAILYDHQTSIPIGSEEDLVDLIAAGLGHDVIEIVPAFMTLDTFQRLGLLRREYGIQVDGISLINDTLTNYFQDHPRSVAPFSEPYLTHFPSATQEDESNSDPQLTFELTFTVYGMEFMRACQGPISAAGD